MGNHQFGIIKVCFKSLIIPLSHIRFSHDSLCLLHSELLLFGDPGYCPNGKTIK